MIKQILYSIAAKLSKYPLSHRVRQMKAMGLLEVGSGTYGTPIIDFYKGSETKISIGNYTSIAPNVRIIAGGIHPITSVSQYPFRSKFGLPGQYEDGNPFTYGDIHIGSDVWIGTGVTILSGVTIGDGAIIGANTLVTNDIPDFAIAYGSPASVIRYRFSEEQIHALKLIAWWSWPESKIIENIEDLTSDNLDSFINKNRIR
jgi:acetyltransferase-like isoleucine patch superfamily enzyme